MSQNHTQNDDQNEPIIADDTIENSENPQNSEKNEESTETTEPVELTEKEVYEQKIEKLEQEKQNLQDQGLRAVADIQNMKRRSDSDRVKARSDGAVSLLLPMVKVIDDLSRAFTHIPEELKDNEFIGSLQTVETAFQKSLTDNAVEMFAENGEKFDAKLHDSLMIDPETPEGMLAQVFEKGVKFKGLVVRHAKVSVGSKK